MSVLWPRGILLRHRLWQLPGRLFYVFVSIPRWKYLARFQVSKLEPNPWRGSGRRGKRQPTKSVFAFPKTKPEFLALLGDGWAPCDPSFLARVFRALP